MGVIKTRTYARAGLVGNPSDGFGGKTISMLVKNFWAEVVLYESPDIEIRLSHHDRSSYRSLQDLVTDVTHSGYYGGVRLIKASIKKFHDYCAESGFEIREANFTVSYDSNIPRQVGLAGSSAIITSCLKALMEFFDVTIEEPLFPNLILSVEREELKITAGLQDRVIQVYGGLVYMDFNPAILSRQGYGNYERMESALLPPFYLLYVEKPSESDKFHSDVRFRFERGDKDVVEAMKRFAALADRAKKAIEAGDHRKLGQLMNANFDLRRKIYGDKVIGKDNLRMIEIARSHGAPAKFSGSGGAIIGLFETEAQYRSIASQARAEGYKAVKVKR